MYDWVVEVMNNIFGAIDMKFKNSEKLKIRMLLACTTDYDIRKSMVNLDTTVHRGKDFFVHAYHLDYSDPRMAYSKKGSTIAKLTYSAGMIELYSRWLDCG